MYRLERNTGFPILTINNERHEIKICTPSKVSLNVAKVSLSINSLCSTILVLISTDIKYHRTQIKYVKSLWYKST